MEQITAKHKNRYEVCQPLPVDNTRPYLSLKNLGKKVSITHGKLRYLGTSRFLQPYEHLVWGHYHVLSFALLFAQVARSAFA